MKFKPREAKIKLFGLRLTEQILQKWHDSSNMELLWREKDEHIWHFHCQS